MPGFFCQYLMDLHNEKKQFLNTSIFFNVNTTGSSQLEEQLLELISKLNLIYGLFFQDFCYHSHRRICVNKEDVSMLITKTRNRVQVTVLRMYLK